MKVDDWQPVDLTPATRREARHLRRRARRWKAVLALYGLVVVCGYVLCTLAADDDVGAVAQRVQQLESRAAMWRGRVGDVHREVDAATRQLAVTHAVARHPDWSVLLALLGRNLRGEVVLRHCALTPELPPDTHDPDEDEEDAELVDPNELELDDIVPRRGYRFVVDGFGSTQTAVSGFILRLERTGLFRDVRLVRTSRQAFRDGQAVAFQIDCVLGRPAGGES